MSKRRRDSLVRWGLALMLAGLASAPGAACAEDILLAFISVDDVKGLLDRGAPVLLVDVRSREEYLARHIAGAISVPLSDLHARYPEIPREGLVVFY